LDLTDGVRISSPLIWECTRFCLAPRASAGIAAALLATGVEIGLRFGLEQAVGVISATNLPLYRRFGSLPDIIGSSGEGRQKIGVGLWPISYDARNDIARRAGIALATISDWFDNSFTGCRNGESIAA